MTINNLLHSPLFEKIKRHICNIDNNDQIFLYVPYIKTRILKKLLEGISNQITIITTWKINDLISGSSELELYQFCKENNITLYIHNKIHLKVYSVNMESVIVASGNISQNGLLCHETCSFSDTLSNFHDSRWRIRRNCRHVSTIGFLNPMSGWK